MLGEPVGQSFGKGLLNSGTARPRCRVSFPHSSCMAKETSASKCPATITVFALLGWRRRGISSSAATAGRGLTRAGNEIFKVGVRLCSWLGFLGRVFYWYITR